MARIKEIFTSIQGEGRYVGCKQLFVRFCGCNLRCKYCDTDNSIEGALELTSDDLLKICAEHKDCHSVSLTGGEPLMQTKFIKEFISKSPLPVYLETNGILYGNLMEIIEGLSYIAADIKLPSATGGKPHWEEHNKFLNLAAKKDVFAKVIFDSNITDEEIKDTIILCKRHGIEIFLQPMMKNGKLSVSKEFMTQVFDKYVRVYNKVRLIPQVHKFLGIE